MDEKMKLDFEQYETVMGLTGPYTKFAEKGEAKAYISARVESRTVPNPKNPENSVPAFGLTIRIRIYGGEGENPMPGFASAFPMANYWKVKQFIPVTVTDNGPAALIKKVQEEVTPAIIAALKEALKKGRVKMTLKDPALTEVLEYYVNQLPLGGRAKVWDGVDFTTAPVTAAS